MATTKIREMPPSERPRERLINHGAGALSDAELLAVLLRTGFQGLNAVELGSQLLRDHGGLPGLARASVTDLKKIKGIKMAKACHLVAAFGLGSRLATQTIGREKLDRPELIYTLLGPEMQHLRVESLRIVLLNTRYQMIKVEEISLGSVNESVAHPREILRPAIVHSAYAFILAHNHPSGDPSPSEADVRLTRRLAEAASLLQINMLDHVIIGAPSPSCTGYYSFKESGLL